MGPAHRRPCGTWPEQGNSTVITLLRILPIRDRWPALLLGLALLVLTLIAGLALLMLSGWFITASALAGLGLIAMINIFTPGAAIRAAALTRTVARYAERLATHSATLQLLTSLRMQVFSRLIAQPALFLERLQRGDALNRLTADIDTLDHVYLGVFQPAAGALLLTLLLVALVATASPLIAFGILAPLLLGNLLIVLACQRLGRESSRLQARAYPRLRQAVMDGLEARLELRALGRVESFTVEIEDQSRALLDRAGRLAVLDAAGAAAILLVNLLAIVICLWIGLDQLDGVRAAGPLLAALIIGLFAVSEAWLGLPAAWRRLNQSIVAAERVTTLCPTPTGSATAPAPAARPWPDHPSVSIHALRFAWAPHQPVLFDDFDLEVGAGERLAIVGASGCGKTTLLRLVMGQIAPLAGRILVGGEDLARLDAPTIGRKMAYLPQNPVLFRDTLAGNLRLAREDAGETELLEALTRAGLDEWVKQLPLGLNTWLDEAAANLSGGERRRLALARLFLGGGEIVLLDEPGASLDDPRLADLNHSLDQWLKGRTTLIVTHREDLLLPVDRTLRL
jgi:ATP-binding cassette subfamily C protein CydC